MRILGIDPGSRITGFGIVDVVESRKLRYVASGCIRLTASSLPERLALLYREMSEILVEHRPEVAAIEKVFMARNADSALKLGHARGAVICALSSCAIPVSEYTALQIKQAVVGRGHATKHQVQHMVRALLHLAGDLQVDAADGLAGAICHAHHGATQRVLTDNQVRFFGGGSR